MTDDSLNKGIVKASGVRAYRAIASPFGRRRVTQLIQDGLPTYLETPLRFLFDDSRSIDDSVRAVVDTIEALRKALASRAAPATDPDTAFESPDSRRTPHELAYGSSVPEEWGTFLYLLAREVGARHMLELGACAGISSCYLASVPSCERFITIEGSTWLSRIATDHLARISDTARVVNGVFDHVLDEVLNAFPDGVDLAFIDGHKDAERILPTIRRVTERLSSSGLLVLDDIRWSSDMGSLWSAMCSSEGFGCALDVGRFGVCIRDAASRRPRVLSLARYTGWLRRAHH